MSTVVISVCGIIIAALSFILSGLIFFTNRSQKRLDTLVSLQTFLHQDVLSEARQCVREGKCEASIQQNPFRRVCSSFDFAGMLVRNEAVDKELFLEYWRLPLISLEPNVRKASDEITGSGVFVKQYYKDFWWLIDEAKATQHIQNRKNSLTVTRQLR